MATYKIHPGIGIARLGNSDTEFYLAPETPAALPQACDESGNPRYQADGVKPLLVRTFKDAQGRIKRQAARFQVFAYDDDSPDGRPLKIGDKVEGGGNRGRLVDIQWRVYLANKKSAWYQFDATAGEHGYLDGHARRNADVSDETRSRLIIDPGPRIVNKTTKRRAAFDRSGGGSYAATFPPATLQPYSIDTLGEIMTDDDGRLLVLGGHGRSGSEKVGPGEPHIDNYANNDGWYDDVSDGPVMARLVMYSDQVKQQRYIDVEYPAWVIAGYPRFVPEILDIVTMDEVLYDLFVRELACDTSLYGRLNSFEHPDHVDFRDAAALRQWRDGRLTWNRAFKPWFYRDIWPILYRPDQFTSLCDVLQQSNAPHSQEERGLFDPKKLGQTPKVIDKGEVESARKQAAQHAILSTGLSGEDGPSRQAVWQDDQGRCIFDEYRAERQYLFGLLRLPGEENEFKLEDEVSSRRHNLPLMPLLCGDNPLSNTAPSKFLRLTEYQLFILKQWADGHFVNELREGWLKRPPYTPFLPYPAMPPKTGRDLDHGVLSNVLGGSFCPGGEASWIMRNPSIYWEPYRIKADLSVAGFLETAAQANRRIKLKGDTLQVEQDYTFNVQESLAQDSDFSKGLQPGDITKYMALPWQADFNRCTTNPVDVTYADWNVIAPESNQDARLEDDRKIWTTLWWPAHRPLQVWELVSVEDGKPVFVWTIWSKGIPQTPPGDVKMVTEWSALPFVVRNPFINPDDFQKQLPDGPIYVATQRTQER